MRTKNFLKHLFLGALLLTTGKVAGQVTTGGNVAAGPTDFLGWNNTFPDNNFPLMVRHDLNQPIEFYTDSILRMKLWHTLGSTINGLTNVRQNGYVGISDQPLFFTTGAGPFSRLHLADSCSDIASQYAQQNGFRRWMRNGITFTGNGDQAYVGHKYNGVNAANDSTDMVIQWSDNAGDVPYGADRLKFIFTDNPLNTSPTATGSKCNEGLEAMRIFIANDSNAFVGVGDWHKATVLNGGATVDPTERLHVNDGTMRMDSLVVNYQNDTLHQVLMSDMQGRVHWRRISTFPAGGGTDCDWTVENDGISGAGVQHDVYTAVNSSNDCPDATDAVGIGMINPLAKLDVLREPQSGDETGIKVVTRSDGNYSGANAIAHGIYSQSTNASGQSPTPNHIAYFGSASNGSKANYGMYGSASSSSTYPASSGNYGGRGEAGGPDKCYGLYGYAYGTGSANYGVYGIAGTGATVHRAGYFAGNLEYTGSLIPPSDQLLKQNIEDLGDALATLLQLQPKTFQFKTEEYPQMHLATGTQMGLIAQDVAQVLPNLVHDCMHPEEYDTTGTLVHEAVPHLGVDYISLIPLLVASVKEQQAMIQQQQDLITDMQQQLASCCAASGEGRALPANQGAAGTSTTQETDLRIIPNPVADRTELRYTVGTEGRVRLTITAPDGRTIRTQDEGLRAVGTYSYGWDTTALAPGTYHCTLFVNDELVVRKAVKVAGR